MKSKELFILFCSVLGGIFAEYMLNHCQKKRLDISKQRLETLQAHYDLLNHWLEIKNEGKSVASYFEDMGYTHIAVYGMAELGNRLMEDLEGSSVCVDYGIDQDICCTIGRIDEVYFPGDKLPKIDAIVVTPYAAFESIKAVLEKRNDCPIISLENVIWSV